jgi:secreted PhoX family phosphatase
MKSLPLSLLFTFFSAFSFAQIGNFTSVEPTFQDELLHIPSSHAFQVLAQEGDVLTDGSSMGQWSDLTAYVPIDGSSTHGYLCVNSEFVPGAVSIFEIQLNPNTKLWEVLNSKNADFTAFNCNAGIAVAGTIANCSGGVTPWGTVVTSEESDEVPQFLCNYQGYKSFGWNVEIDPLTGDVVDYDNDGNPDKVWAMGNMKHENVAFANDSLTVYQGEDNSSAGFLYKFIMDNKTDLSSGKLYALKLASNWITSGEATWILIPNTTKSERNDVTAATNSLGATKFDRVEDIEIGPDGKIYFTSTGQNIVFRFNDVDNATANGFEIFIDNVNVPIQTESGTFQALFAAPDNLAFDNQGNLWINQDGGENYFWMVEPTHTVANPKVHVFANTPNGCESTGTHFTPDGKYMFISIQHPEATNVAWQNDVADRSVVFDKSATMVIALNEDLGDTTTGIAGPMEDTGMFNTLVVYPNPVAEVFNISLNSAIYDYVDIIIYDATGKQVKTTNLFVNLGRNELQIDASQLTVGQYVLTLRHRKGHITTTFQK